MSTSPAPARVSIRRVNRTFGTHTVLDHVDIEIAPGEVVALLGSSGSGESTLLRIVAGLDRPTDGRIEIDGNAVRGIDPRCAVVFQEPRLLPWRSLAANVAFGLPPGTARSKGAAAVQHWLDVVGLGEFGDHYPRQVSGGMAQRAGLARALARRPSVLLLDEPLAALDALTRLRMQDLLDTVQQEAGTTTLLVTHDVDEALILADRVLVLRADGAGGPVLPRRSKSPFPSHAIAVTRVSPCCVSSCWMNSVYPDAPAWGLPTRRRRIRVTSIPDNSSGCRRSRRRLCLRFERREHSGQGHPTGLCPLQPAEPSGARSASAGKPGLQRHLGAFGGQ